MENLSSTEVKQVMDMLDIIEIEKWSDKQIQASQAADESMAEMVQRHGKDETLGACARFLRERLDEAENYGDQHIGTGKMRKSSHLTNK